MLRAHAGRVVGSPERGSPNVVAREPGGTVPAVLTPDPRPTSFQHHPGLRDREAEARRLADVLRRLIRLSVSTAPPAAETTHG